MATCKKCGRAFKETAKVLSLCADCIRKADAPTLAELQEIHAQIREKFGLPTSPPSRPEGLQCRLCQNKCRIPAGGRGYCGVAAAARGWATKADLLNTFSAAKIKNWAKSNRARMA